MRIRSLLLYRFPPNDRLLNQQWGRCPDTSGQVLQCCNKQPYPARDTCGESLTSQVTRHLRLEHKSFSNDTSWIRQRFCEPLWLPRSTAPQPARVSDADAEIHRRSRDTPAILPALAARLCAARCHASPAPDRDGSDECNDLPPVRSDRRVIPWYTAVPGLPRCPELRPSKAVTTVIVVTFGSLSARPVTRVTVFCRHYLVGSVSLGGCAAPGVGN
jgi:hypothetical protein